MSSENDPISTLPPSDLTPKQDRNSDGTFGKGNQARRKQDGGTPPATTEEAFDRVATPERLEKLYEKMMKRAEGGAIEAVKFFSDYKLGKPDSKTGARQFAEMKKRVDIEIEQKSNLTKANAELLKQVESLTRQLEAKR